MFEKLLIITNYTFKEMLKSKVFYITFIIGIAIALITYVATEFTYGVPEKVALDFGLGMLSFSSLGISIFMGANLLPKEIDSRTVYMVISRPVPRWIFITGKILGLLMVLVVNISILSIITLICSSLLGGEINQVTLIAIVFNLLEAALLILVVVFFSLFSNTIITSSMSIVILMLGHAVKETQNSLFVQSNELLKTTLELYHLVLPAFYKLNFKNFVVYNQTLPSTFIWQAFGYGTCYSIFLFLMITYIFNKKNLD